MRKHKFWLLVGLVVALSLALAACQPETVTVVETVVVEKEGETVVETVEVEVEKEVVVTEVVEKEDAKPLKNFEKSVVYQDVHFAYDKEEEIVLKDINIKVQKGEVIAFVGQSGAGKTTLVDLLPRFYDVDAGTIEIDGQNINEFTLS